MDYDRIKESGIRYKLVVISLAVFCDVLSTVDQSTV
jgi:hypothetical protein